MLPGYHTAGLQEHDRATALRQLASIGYRAAAIRLHRSLLDPDDPGRFRADLDPATCGRRWAAAAGALALVIDADGRFLIDPWEADGPGLLAADAASRQQRQQTIRLAITLAAAAGASLVTFSCGQTPSERPAEEALETLAEAVAELLEDARQHQVRLAIRPVIGGGIATVAHFERLLQWLPPTSSLWLAADIASMVRQGELPVMDFLDRQAARLACVYLADLRAGEPGDQRIGGGEVAIRRIAEGLRQRGYAGPAIIRVEGHAADGLAVARQAYNDVFA